MARPRPQVATTTAVLILFLVAEVVSSGQATTIVLRPPHGGSNRHTMFLPLFLSPPPNSYSGNSSPSVHRQIQGSDPLHPNARMLLYDDLLLNGARGQRFLELELFCLTIQSLEEFQRLPLKLLLLMLMLIQAFLMGLS